MIKDPGRDFHLGLILLVAFNLLIHINTYLGIVVVMGGACLAWRTFYEFQKIKLPPFWLKWIFVFLSFAWVQLQYGTLLGLDAGAALLIMSVCLKVLDRARYHDAMVVLFLNFMLLLVRVVDDQSLWMTLVGAFDLVIVTALLVQLHTRNDLSIDLQGLLKTGFKLILQTTPFLFLLFFVFPRYTTQFGLVPMAGKTSAGFSADMEPGRVSQVAQSDLTAFRVRFQGTIPGPRERYWRGLVLEKNQGMSWSVFDSSKKRVKPQRGTLSQVEQEILIEPRFEEWLFVLEKPISLSFDNKLYNLGLVKNDQDVYSLKKPLTQKAIYIVESVLQKSSELSELQRKVNLSGVGDITPRMKEWINQIQMSAKTEKQKAYKVMSYFKNNFRYTLSPGPLQNNTVDEFFFEKKVGFCEHFAASFTYIMRAMGVPARVVI
ncbi:MAG: DUF3488 domain-containing transglutaminase family protein, partial [Bdellovibrionales bacterium]|nr:DUF3488 and transglutaminase-like domain-containing protein [Bdellovibrionales bacterium]NQZ20402.1 DUF3488 domain-containing transglutaminase family protein [Bdellovibrionales bacterium]